MIKVLDLFAGTQSVKKALTEKYNILYWTRDHQDGTWIGYDDHTIAVEYKGIDIYSPEDKNIIIDLVSDFALEMIKDRLGKWIPDLIWASPVCNKFSTACAYINGNLFFEKVGEDSLKIRTNWNDKNNKAYPYDKCQDNKKRYIYEAEIALKMHNNCKKIINYFNVNFIIENPRRAMSKYLYKDYVNNFTSYCMYGFKYEKPTTIYSNKILNLKTCNHKPKRDFHTIMLSGSSKDYTNGRKNMSSYSKRSSVPPKLIIEIIDQLLESKNE